MAKLFVNSGDPDQTLHSAASDLSLHCLPITLLRVSRLQWVNLLELFLDELSPLSGWPVLVHILSSITHNCPSWINRKGTMAVEIISWSISMKVMRLSSGFELVTSWSAVSHSTDCAREPSEQIIKCFSLDSFIILTLVLLNKLRCQAYF